MSGINDALDRMDALLDPACGFLSVGYDSVTATESVKDMAAIRAHIAKQAETRSALVDALKTAREYVTSELSRERENFKGHENCSSIPAIERDLAQIDAALLAAGDGL